MISVQVIDKSSGKYRLVKTIGSSSDAAEVAELVRQAETWIKERQGQLNLDFSVVRQGGFSPKYSAHRRL